MNEEKTIISRILERYVLTLGSQKGYSEKYRKIKKNHMQKKKRKKEIKCTFEVKMRSLKTF
jgi:hypothetical protein